MANIANLITKLSGIIASLDDIRDAISQGGGGSSTASGVTVTPVAPLTGTNLQATTNETAALLQEHTDDISTLNSSIQTLGEVVTNGTSDMAKYNVFFVILDDVWVQGIPCITGVFFKKVAGVIPYVTNNGSTTVSAWIQLAYDTSTNSIHVAMSWNSLGSTNVPTISKIIGVC